MLQPAKGEKNNFKSRVV